jgi:hypothetical protein
MKRSPATAFWLSMLPGAGHVYIGQPTKGLVLIVSVASAIYLASEGAGAFVGIIIPFLWIFSMIDAHRSAVELNHLIDTGQPIPLSGDPGFAISSWWGWVLIVIGVVFTVDNYGWLDIDWIFKLWPVILIALGVYLLKKPASAPPASELPKTEADDG